jgi:hypothetical protein
MVFCRSNDDPCTSENAPSGIRDVETGNVVLLLLLLLLLLDEEDEEDEDVLDVDEVELVEVIVEEPVAFVDVSVLTLKRISRGNG